jgi:hypothetical protein
LVKRQNDLLAYLEISAIYDSDRDIVENEYFRRRYKAFYRMNMVGLTEEYFKRYFNLLGLRYRLVKEDLTNILTRIDGIPTKRSKNSLQFSFATKMLHTTNYQLPIYDSRLGKFFNLRQPSDTKFASVQRIATRQGIYNNLVVQFNELLADPDVIDLITAAKKELAARVREDKILTINEVKMLDFLIWAQEIDKDKKN